MRLGIGFAQSCERLPRKHNSPAEGIVRAVAFIDGEVVGGVSLFHQDGEVHARRSAADDVDFHAASSSNTSQSLWIPISNSSGSAHIPMRKWFGDSKKRPG